MLTRNSVSALNGVLYSVVQLNCSVRQILKELVGLEVLVRVYFADPGEAVCRERERKERSLDPQLFVFSTLAFQKVMSFIYFRLFYFTLFYFSVVFSYYVFICWLFSRGQWWWVVISEEKRKDGEKMSDGNGKGGGLLVSAFGLDDWRGRHAWGGN